MENSPLKEIIYPQRSPRLTHGGACFFPFSGWNSWPTIHYESLALKSNPIKRGCFRPHDPTKTTMRHVRISRVSASSYLAQPAHPGMSHSSCHVLLPNPWRRNTMELGELEGSGFDWDLVVPFSIAQTCRQLRKIRFFSSLIWPAGYAPAALARWLFDPPGPQITGKTQWLATFLPFRTIEAVACLRVFRGRLSILKVMARWFSKSSWGAGLRLLEQIAHDFAWCQGSTLAS